MKTSNSLNLELSILPTTGVMGIQYHILVFTWILGIWTVPRVFTTSTEPSSKPCKCSFCQDGPEAGMSPSLGMGSFSIHVLLGDIYPTWPRHPHSPPENATVAEIIPASCATTKEPGGGFKGLSFVALERISFKGSFHLWDFTFLSYMHYNEENRLRRGGTVGSLGRRGSPLDKTSSASKGHEEILFVKSNFK